MRHLVRFGTSAGLAVFASLSFACGGDSLEKVDADDWVEDVCDEAFDFDDDLADAAEELAIIEDGDVDEIRDAVEEFEKLAHEAIDSFVEAIEEVGEPDIEGGGDVIKAIRAHADAEKKSISDFRDTVEDIDEDDEDDFRDQVIEAIDDVEDLDLRDRLEDIDENDVDDLIDEIDANTDCGFVMFSS